MNDISTQKRAELLELYSKLRVADVRDGMDWVMMHPYGSMHYSMTPLFRTRAVGIAKTARYVPYDGPMPAMTPREYDEWVGYFYDEVCIYPWADELVDGDFMVIDQSGVDCGLIGSNNGLKAYISGCRGFVIDGGVRDTDELVIQKVPVWSKFISQGMVQARLKYESHNMPVSVGGVNVNPGDIIVADGDGVIVVPQKIAVEVAVEASHELRGDKAGRRALYESLGWELDDTVID